MFRNANGQEPGAVTPIKKSAGGDRATTTDFKNDSKSVAACDRLAMVITPTQAEPRIDSRLLARQFGKRHRGQEAGRSEPYKTGHSGRFAGAPRKGGT